MLKRVGWALRQARAGILIIGAIYAVSLAVGILMAHTGNRFALSYRDSLVARAHRADPAARANDAGAHGVAAAFDFSRNLGLGAIPETIGGLTLVLPVGLAEGRPHQVAAQETHGPSPRLATPALSLAANPTSPYVR